MTETATMPTDDPYLTDWTNDQESALLRAITHYKPVGMHKHFRMISIRHSLHAESPDLLTTNSEPDAPHTTTTGIWRKLGTLYDLPGLDEREDAEVNDHGDEELKEYWRDFELPREEFEGLMWERRLAPEGDSSSPELELGMGTRRRESTVADTDEPRSSPAPGSSRGGGGRGGRGGARKSGRLSRLQNEMDTDSPAKGGSEADEDHTMEDADDVTEGSGSGGGEEETEEDDGADEERKGSAKRGRGGKRGRGRGRGRRRG